jgi:hypothetical protein
MSVVLWWYHLRGSGVVAPPAAPAGGGHMPGKRKTVWIPEDSSVPVRSKTAELEAFAEQLLPEIETVEKAAPVSTTRRVKVASFSDEKPAEDKKPTHIERILMLVVMDLI